MARSAPHACVGGCGELVRGRARCPSCEEREQARRYGADKDRDRGRKSLKPWRAVYRTERWKKLARRILRERPTCERCRSAPSAIVDHRIPLGPPAWPDPFDESNLDALCRPCHGIKTAEDYRRERRQA